MEKRLVNACEKAVKLALRSGAEAAEAFASYVAEQSISLKREEPGPFTRGVREGIGLRVFVVKHIGFFSVSSLGGDSLKMLVAVALASAKASPEDEGWKGFASPSRAKPVEGIFDPEIISLEPERLVGTASEIYDTIDAFDGHVKLVLGGIGAGFQINAIANSNGVEDVRSETNAFAGVYMRAEEAGSIGTALESRNERLWRLIDMEGLVMRAGCRAIDMMKATTIPPTKLDVIFENRTAAGFVSGMILPLVLADAVQQGRSPWVGMIGKKVLPSCFNITDRGDLTQGLGSKSFDDEGVQTQTTPVVEKGVLVGFLYDTYTASKEGRHSTGNAVRGGGSLLGGDRRYNSPPRPGPTNFILEQGEASIQELEQSTKVGLYVVDVIGDWLSNPVAQIYSATVTEGYLVSQGEARKPVKGLSISCDLKKLNDEDTMIAKDLDHVVNIYSPSMKISNLNISS